MASSTDIQSVRTYANVPTNEAPFTDEVIGSMIDALGVSGATAEVLRRRIPILSTVVDVTEAGASHKLSQIVKEARESLAYWEKKAAEDGGGENLTGRTRVHKVVRS